MKICLAQSQSINGDLPKNLQNHLRIIQRAVEWGTELIVFPELSLTGYEPTLAKGLAREVSDPTFYPFQTIADENGIAIAIGMPLKMEKGIVIGMLIFQPNIQRMVYAKQILHKDELPYFVAGREQVFINLKNKKIAFGICYETLQRAHFLKASQADASIYLASVAKPERGIAQAYPHFSRMAAEFSIPVLMTNSVGFYDNFVAAGQTAFWNEEGHRVAQLNDFRSGVLLVDLRSNSTEKHYF